MLARPNLVGAHAKRDPTTHDNSITEWNIEKALRDRKSGFNYNADQQSVLLVGIIF